MRTIKQDELFHSLGDFLKHKGIELKDGEYSDGIRRVCNLLGEAINATRKTAKKAKEEVDKKLDQARQSIHEATAPRSQQPPPANPAAAPTASAAPEAPPPSAAAPKPPRTPGMKRARAGGKGTDKRARAKRKA